MTLTQRPRESDNESGEEKSEEDKEQEEEAITTFSKKESLIMCCICQDEAYLPFQMCQNHIACHECINNGANATSSMDSSNQMTLDDKIVFPCPICRSDEYKILAVSPEMSAEIRIFSSGPPPLESPRYGIYGIQRVPIQFLHAVYKRGMVFKCPYCSKEGDIGAICKHVQECGMRTIVCPRCKDEIEVKSSLTEHILNNCDCVRCKYCSHTDSSDMIKIHEECHSMLRTECRRMLMLCEERCFDIENNDLVLKAPVDFHEALTNLKTAFDRMDEFVVNHRPYGSYRSRNRNRSVPVVYHQPSSESNGQVQIIPSSGSISSAPIGSLFSSPSLFMQRRI